MANATQGDDTGVDDQDLTPPGEDEHQDNPELAAATNARIRDLLASNKALTAALATAAATKQPAAPARQAPVQQDIPVAVLRQQVDEGKITQEQMDEIWTAQIIRAATNASVNANRQIETAQTVSEQLNRYKELVPGLADKTSPDFAKVKKEFETLVAAGSPNSTATEYAAARAVFGDVKNLATRLKARRAGSDTFEDGGAGLGDDTGGRQRQTGIEKELTPKQREYYSKNMGPGKLYADWKAVDALFSAGAKAKAEVGASMKTGRG